VYSQVWKNAPRSCPEIRSARAMNCSVVALPPAWVRVQVRSSRKKLSSPIEIRNWCRVMPPRQ
jgi:hypothetical protein